MARDTDAAFLQGSRNMGWTDKLLTGIAEIDNQHQTLFDMLARLEATVGTPKSWAAVHFALVELSDYVRIHFAVEEALMRLHDYQDLELHISQHHEFISVLARLKHEAIVRDIGQDMVRFLHNWLVSHIGKSDRDYVSHLRTSPVGGPSPVPA